MIVWTLLLKNSYTVSVGLVVDNIVPTYDCYGNHIAILADPFVAESDHVFLHGD